MFSALNPEIYIKKSFQLKIINFCFKHKYGVKKLRSIIFKFLKKNLTLVLNQ